MPLSTVAKAALCICPPALMAGTVATVPPVKRAVHHLTANRPAASKPVRRTTASTPVRSAAATPRAPDCAPVLGGALPEVPLVTYADPIPDEPGGFSNGGGFGGGVPVVGGIGIGGGGGGGGGIVPDNPGEPGNPGAGPIPEPSVWLMMIAGVGTLGGLLRRRRTAAALRSRGGARRRSGQKAIAGGMLWSGSAAVEAGDMAATVAVKSAMASAAGKAMLCVCPAAIVAGTVMTVPPVRQAVHTATTVPVVAPPVTLTPSTIPCEPVTVPVAANSVDGFPAAVQTTRASAPAVAAQTPAAPVASASTPVTAAPAMAVATTRIAPEA